MLAGLMMLPFLAAAAAAAAAATPADVSVEVADGDWSKLPQLEQRGYDHLSAKAQVRLFEIANSSQCQDFQLKQGRLDLRLGFAVKYEDGDRLARLILPKLGCAEAEGVTGGALLEMFNAGDYRPTGKSGNGWYQGTLAFSYAGDEARDPAVATAAAQPGAVTGPKGDETVCQKLEIIGSRLSAKTVCMTRAEWAQRKKDDRESVERAQTQRGCRDTQC